MNRFFMTALILLFILTLPACAQTVQDSAGAQEAAKTKPEVEYVYVSKGYRYDPVDATEDADAGLFLCGTRCNALSVDYLNITTPGGWRMLRVAKDHEVSIDLKKMGIKGNCICIADQYVVKVNDLYMSK